MTGSRVKMRMPHESIHVTLQCPCDALALHAGAKLDVQLMKQSKSAGSPSFCRAMVLRRLHGHVGPLQNLQYRFHLLQVFLHPHCLCQLGLVGKYGATWLLLHCL